MISGYEPVVRNTYSGISVELIFAKTLGVLISRKKAAKLTLSILTAELFWRIKQTEQSIARRRRHILLGSSSSSSELLGSESQIRI